MARNTKKPTAQKATNKEIAEPQMKADTQTDFSQQLEEALDEMDRPGTFYSAGSAKDALPGLDVTGVGAIGLPLTEAQAKTLKSKCDQAPHGQGEKTVLDTSVRRVWRLQPDQFTLTNPDWPAILQKIVSKVQTDLGLKGQKLEAHLYELLLYEPGSFFLPHRDGEKLDRMVATLTIVLPSVYKGGELIVRSEGEEQTIDFSAESPFRTHFAAFYADCEHEVKPLRKGHRLSLVYNLTLARKKKSIGAPRTAEHIDKLAAILTEWSQTGVPQKLAITLTHQYTQDGLEWDALKGVDRTKANALAKAAPRAGCQAHLALLTLYESGAAADEYRPSRRYRYYGDDNDHADGKHKMGEVYDTSLTAEHWRSLSGRRPSFGPIPVDRSQVVPPDALTDIDPEESFEGYTGNEGLTLERWYRHAVIVLWPDRLHLDVLVEVGSQKAIPMLAEMLSKLRYAGESESAAQKAVCVEFAAKILAAWPANPYRHNRSEAADPIASILELDEPQLIKLYIDHVLAKDVLIAGGKPLCGAIIRHGWATFRPELLRFAAAATVDTIERDVRLLDELCVAATRAARDKSAEARKTCHELAESVLAAMLAIDSRTETEEWRLSRLNRVETLVGLTRATLAIGADALLVRLLAHVRNTLRRYPLRTVQVPALMKLSNWLQSNVKHAPESSLMWISACIDQLAAMTSTPPQAPTDFRRAANIDCKCDDCNQLKQFLSDPQLPEQGFKIAERRRKHLAGNIDHARCDLTYTTDKRTTPQILVCTKTTASYERGLTEYQEDLDYLANLKSLRQHLPK